MRRTTITYSASAEVGAPPEELFALLTDDDWFFDLRPGAIDHRDIEPLPNGGHSCTQVFEARGRRIALRCRTTEFAPPLLLVDEVEAPNHMATVRTTLTPAGIATTRLTIEQQVTIPDAVGPFRRYVIRRDAERRLAAALVQIKQVADGAVP